MIELEPIVVKADVAVLDEFVNAQVKTEIVIPSEITVEPLTANENGTYTAPPMTAYSPVNVSVPQTDVQPLEVTENGNYEAQEGAAFNPVSVNVPQTTIEPLMVTQNGNTIAPSGKAYSPVTVAVPSTQITDERFVENGSFEAPDGTAWGRVQVDVPNTYAAQDEGKVVSGGALVAQTHTTVTENGTIDTTLNDSVTVDVPSKTEDVLTATENDTYTPQAGHVYSSAVVNVPWLMQGPNPVENLGVIYEEETALKDTGFATWTPSATAAVIQESNNNAATFSADMANYEYALLWEFEFDPAYPDGTTILPLGGKYVLLYLLNVIKRASTFDEFVNKTFHANFQASGAGSYCLMYYDTNNLQKVYHGAVGIYAINNGLSFSNNYNDSITVTLKSLQVSARANATYFSIASMAALDQEKSKFKMRCTLYRTPIGGITRQMYEALTDLYNNPIVISNQGG